MTDLWNRADRTDTYASVRDYLRAIPSLVGDPVGFDPGTYPATPQPLFLEWLLAAEAAGIPEPHAMTVSTVDADGIPDARMLVLKDLTPDGAWCFAGKRDSSKGHQLVARPVAALTFYWRDQLRSVRIRGPITEGSADEANHDFIARSMNARAVALSGRQSVPLDSRDELVRDVETAQQRLRHTPDLVPDGWSVWKLDPTQVEFWEGSNTRLHTRLLYERATSGWRVSQLRP
jgi:pyridoxamine 5'-phosphate oxidase